MKMKAPVHPGALVKECIDERGSSVEEASAELGISLQHLLDVIEARSSITGEMAIRLESAFGGTADTWLRMQLNYDLA